MKTAALLMVCVSALLTACGASPYAVSEGIARDTIFSVEPRNNGTTTLWLTHDDVGAYCTTDSSLRSQLLQIIEGDSTEIVLRYRSVNNTDPEWSWIGAGDGCARDKATTVYKIISVEQVTADGD